MLKPNAALSLHGGGGGQGKGGVGVGEGRGRSGVDLPFGLKRHPQVCPGSILPAVRHLLWGT